MGELTTAKVAISTYLLGDIMKKNDREIVGGQEEYSRRFVEGLAEARKGIEGMSWTDAVAMMKSIDPGTSRPDVYPDMWWEWQEVSLCECLVWPRMGNRDWGVGSVDHVADEASRPGRDGDPVHVMVQKWDAVPFRDMHVIVVRLTNCRFRSRACRFGLDDGNHRAVASYLAGTRVVKALVGSGHRYYDDQFSYYRGS